MAAVLCDLDRDGAFLTRRIRYTEADVTRAGYAPVTGEPENLANGMTVEALCAAAIADSDNTAMNLLLHRLGGPWAVTRFCRSIGDATTRLDRWEPDLNSAEPGRMTDTTSPRAIARTYQRLTLGRALDAADRDRITGWLLANTTGDNRLRAGLPAGWRVAEKTGSGAYGTTNDAGITWPPDRAPSCSPYSPPSRTPTLRPTSHCSPKPPHWWQERPQLRDATHGPRERTRRGASGRQAVLADPHGAELTVSERRGSRCRVSVR